MSNIKKKERKKEKEKEVSYFLLFPLGRFTLSNTVHTMSKLQTTQGPYDGAMEMKSKLYLRIVLLINYMMEENLFVYVECSTVKHAASRFSVKKRKEQE